MHPWVRSLSLLACATLVAGCASQAGREVSVGAPTNNTNGVFDCPVTLPPAKPFIPARPWPRQPVGPNLAWFGTDALWTVVDVNGRYSPRKSVWWSAKFPGGDVEEKPPISVTWRRLDTEMPPIVEPGPGTNAFTPEEQWWMIGGIDPDAGGCWEVTGSYKGATLRYVYRRDL